MSLGRPITKLAAVGITKEFVQERNGNRVVAVQDLALTVASGEFVTIVGPSGCGKSTFLRIVGGLTRPTRGSLTLDGAPLTGPGPDRGIVFQHASLLPWYSVLRNAAYGLECRGVPSSVALARAREVVKLVGLSGFEDHYPHELSGGMQQRVNLARALAVDPDVLLMDEPFAALDAQTRELMQEELLNIWSTSNKTVLFITHQIDEAVYLSDRVLVMSARPGRILAEVPIDLARPRPLDIKLTPEFVAYQARIWSLIQGEARHAMQYERADAAEAGGAG